MSPVGKLIIIGICLFFQGFFCAAEMALVSANRLRIRHLVHAGSGPARLIQKMLDHPEKFLSTAMVGINVFLVLGSTVASFLVSRSLDLGDRGPFIATLIMLPLVLIFSEIVPKNLVRPRATRISLFFSYPLQFFYYLFYPLIQTVSLISTGIIRIFGVKRKDTRLFSSVDDILLLMQEGQQQGTLTESERKMISRVFDFGENDVSDIMVPLIDVTVAPAGVRVKEITGLINQTGHTRIPIYQDRVDKIIGTVQVTDLVMAKEEEPISSYIRPPYIVPESKPLEELLEELRNNDVNMAIAVDEYGGVAGIVTLENVIEEIVGEIRDEYDLEEVSLFRLKGKVADVSGRMRLDELNEKLTLNLPEDNEEETLAGFIIDLLGKIPDQGEKVSYQEHLFTIIQVTDRRIVRLEIRGPAVTARSAASTEPDIPPLIPPRNSV